MIKKWQGNWYRISPEWTGGLHITIKGLPDVCFLLPTYMKFDNLHLFEDELEPYMKGLRNTKTMCKTEQTTGVYH